MPVLYIWYCIYNWYEIWFYYVIVGACFLLEWYSVSCPLLPYPFVLCQPIWDAIANFHPQIFIWMGDNIYGDSKRPFKIFGPERTIGPWKNIPRFFPSSQEEMEAKYRKAKTSPGYSKLREQAEVLHLKTLYSCV